MEEWRAEDGKRQLVFGVIFLFSVINMIDEEKIVIILNIAFCNAIG